ncbi:MAG: carbohydrate binding family 9 domain-containing protein [Holophagales bacterium]|nr:carbohydrate binding family 9 domain-containing protein [Holophagales bacterium]
MFEPDRSGRRVVRVAFALAVASSLALTGSAAAKLENGPAIEIHRASGPIEIDGDLSDAGWRDATRVESWWEVNPGDNVVPEVENVAWLAFDGEYLYAAFEFADPEPGGIRAPLADRDHVPSYTDYGGVILDPRGDGKTAQMFLANPRGIQYDAISSDATGEDSAPDFFWESAGRVTESGWRLELRIPFASIRYTDPNPESWGILLYRNHPRAYRYQYFSSRLPKERNCFICNVRDLTGMSELPRGGHWVVAPFATAQQSQRPEGDLGTPLASDDGELDGGVDAKWLPNPDTVVDVTLNPDFSQIESDVANITANERFALFLPEKRPFFLESVDLLDTPINAVYTRSFVSPKWGARATGGTEKWKYTLLVGEDRGGGSVILPGAEESSLAEQDFSSIVSYGRVRREIGSSFVSVLYTGREIDGGGSNRVIGPDFEWRPTDQDTITGQLLWSATKTPDRPDLADEWDGRSLEGYAGRLWWSHSTGTWDTFVEYLNFDDEFRADDGFVPQVGIQTGYGEVGYTWRWDDRAVRRLRTFGWLSYDSDQEGKILQRQAVTGFGLDAPLNSFVRLELASLDLRSGPELFRVYQIRPSLEIRPGKVFSHLYFQGNLGEQVDFANDRKGDGGTVRLDADLLPGDHLALALSLNRRWLDVDDPALGSGRLFTSDVARLKAVYTFNARTWLRLIGQWVETERDPTLYRGEVDAHAADLSGSLTFAYKLNWQTVLYVGYSDLQLLEPELDTLEPASRELFLKVSYAFRG